MKSRRFGLHVATAILVAAPVCLFASRVEARCLAHAGYTVNSSFGYELPSGGTCNGDNNYQFGVYDNVSDGHCVAAAQYINGVWNYYSFYSCHDYGTAYGFNDANSYTLMYLRWYEGGNYTPQIENSTF
jgi:hypothetical protein